VHVQAVEHCRRVGEAERTAVGQGLPPKVIDVAVLRQVVQILGLDKVSERLESSERTLAHTVLRGS